MPGPSSSTWRSAWSPSTTAAHRHRGPGELARVLEEVRSHLGQSIRITGDHGRLRAVDPHGEPGVLEVGTKALGGAGGDIGEVDRAEIEGEASGIETGEVEEVSNETLEPAGLGHHDAGGRRRVLGGAIGDRLGPAPDRGERRPQIVGHRQQELALEPRVSVRARRPWR